MTPTRWLLGNLLVAMLAALNQAAQADGIEGVYLGASAGVAKIRTDNAAYQTELQGEVAGFGNLDFTSASLHDRKTFWWANAGYMAWPLVGIDVSYLHTGELYNQVNGTFNSLGGSVQSVGAATRLRSAGPALGLLLRLPLVERFDVNFRIADYYARTTLTNILNAATYTAPRETENASTLLLGLGASYRLAGHWSARLDYLRMEHAGDSKTLKYNVSMLALGTSYTF